MNGTIMYLSFEHLRAFQEHTEVYLLSKVNRDRNYIKSCVFSQNYHGEIRFFNITYRIFHKNQNVLKSEVISSVLNKSSDNSFAWQF